MRNLLPFLAAVISAGCATPVVMLKHEATGQVARCGGGTAGSMAGGLIGKSIEESSDQQCVRDYESRGFRRVSGANEPTPAGSPPSPPPRAEAPRAAAAPPAPAPVGRDAYIAERVARDAKCSQTGTAALIARGPGFESYSMQCTSGDVMLIRCEMGSCRPLK